eukprot:scaffold40283_cov65-Phaeocystis_antarctica.AAC.5
MEVKPYIFGPHEKRPNAGRGLSKIDCKCLDAQLDLPVVRGFTPLTPGLQQQELAIRCVSRRRSPAPITRSAASRGRRCR